MQHEEDDPLQERHDDEREDQPRDRAERGVDLDIIFILEDGRDLHALFLQACGASKDQSKRKNAEKDEEPQIEILHLYGGKIRPDHAIDRKKQETGRDGTEDHPGVLFPAENAPQLPPQQEDQPRDDQRHRNQDQQGIAHQPQAVTDEAAADPALGHSFQDIFRLDEKNDKTKIKENKRRRGVSHAGCAGAFHQRNLHRSDKRGKNQYGSCSRVQSDPGSSVRIRHIYVPFLIR